MAIPNTGPLTMSTINGEFGHGTNLGAYNAKQWYKFDGTAGNFSLPIKYSDFYGKQKATAYAYIDVKTSTDVTVAKTQNVGLLIIGGGGCGGDTVSSYPLEGGGGGGGGGFYFIDFTAPATAGGILRCTIGAGATNRALTGGDTTVSHIVNGVTVWTYTAKGGGRGSSWGGVGRVAQNYLNTASGGTSREVKPNGASGGGGLPYYGDTNYATALILNPMQGNDGARGIEDQTGGGGGGARADSYGRGQNGGGIRSGEGGGYMPQASGGSNGGYGRGFSLYGFGGDGTYFCSGGASSGGASGGQWRTYGMGGSNTLGYIFGANYVGTSPGDTYLYPSGFAVAARPGLPNTGQAGGGTWNLGQNSGGAGGSGRVVIWYNP